MVVSPDVGGIKMAHAYSQTLEPDWPSWPSAARARRKWRAWRSSVKSRAKNILLVDDLTETAGTLTQAAAVLKTKGAKKILACVSHALLNDTGIERLRKSCY